MSNTPHRPFVRKQTSAEPSVARPPKDFRVVRPFVHGQTRSYQAELPVAEAKPVASIADFLAMDRPAPTAEPVAVSTPVAVSYSPNAESALTVSAQLSESAPSIADYLAQSDFEPAAYEAESDYELPPIEHFTDVVLEEDIPPAEVYAESLMDPFGASTDQPPPDPHGWEETDWQRYDWSAAAALGEAGDPAATSAWAQTDWGKPAASAKSSRESAARAIADALDGIARRIRDGDLVIPPPPAAVPDPATIAATLAALLGVRR